MIKLSDRLQAIADYINTGETVADIGTDHGFLPIFLYESGKSPHVILSDINKGPLEKAKENIKKLFPENMFDIRFGSGLLTIDRGEVDTVVIAGMGGLLIADILGFDMKKTKSYNRFILQPRNSQAKLRHWLFKNNFYIVDERLIREGKYICEIILTEPVTNECNIQEVAKNFNTDKLDFEFSPILFKNKDPLLAEFIHNKIRIEKNIIKDLLKGASINNYYKLEKSEQRIVLLRELMEKSGRDEYDF